MEIKKDYFNAIVEELQEEINKLNSDDCCIVITIRCDGYYNILRHVYKNIEDFKERAFKESKKIDGMFGIDFSIWAYS